MKPQLKGEFEMQGDEISLTAPEGFVWQLVEESEEPPGEERDVHWPAGVRFLLK